MNNREFYKELVKETCEAFLNNEIDLEEFRERVCEDIDSYNIVEGV
jgi:hypothetical protein